MYAQPAEAELSTAPYAAGPTRDAQEVRARAVEMAQRWSDVVQDLVRQLEEQESERRELMDRIGALEKRLEEQEPLRQAMSAASIHDPISGEDLRVAQYVTDELLRDPDHLVVLATVAQNAQRLARIVNRYAEIHRALGGNPPESQSPS
jgi:Rad3-related DNA helicase